MNALYEKYRPHTFDDVVGQDKAVATIKRIIKREGWGGQAWWLSGISGCGKTTLARIIASIGADDYCIDEFDCGDVLSMDDLARLDRALSFYGWGLTSKTGRAVIVNEAHGLRAAPLRRLLGMLERIPSHVAWIFTTTCEGQEKLVDDQTDASPLLSRSHEIRLSSQGLCKPFASLAQSIAKAEGLDGKPLAAYEALAKENHNNLRRMLMAIADRRMMEVSECQPIR